MDDNALRNIKRINLKLKPLVNIFSKKQKEVFKNYSIIRNKTLYTLDKINFNEPMVFICNEDFSSYISYYGIIKINNVKVPDTTEAGTYSVINTKFMIADSQDIRFSKIPIDSFYDLERDGNLPESWNSINYVKKDLVIWRLVSDVGIGDNDKMYTGCYSWISERIRQGLLDWIFYIGSKEQFEKEYKDIAALQLPTYEIKLSSTVRVVKAEDKKDV